MCLTIVYPKDTAKKTTVGYQVLQKTDTKGVYRSPYFGELNGNIKIGESQKAIQEVTFTDDAPSKQYLSGFHVVRKLKEARQLKAYLEDRLIHKTVCICKVAVKNITSWGLQDYYTRFKDEVVWHSIDVVVAAERKLLEEVE